MSRRKQKRRARIFASVIEALTSPRGVDILTSLIRLLLKPRSSYDAPQPPAR